MKRIVSVLLCILFVSSLAVVPAFDTGASSLAEARSEKSRIDSNIAAATQKLNELEAQKKKEQEYLNALDGQISAVQAKIDYLQDQINALDTDIEKLTKEIKQLEGEIATKEDEIDATQQEITDTINDINANKDELSKRLRYAYINGAESNLKLFMGSSSLADFLTRLELMKRTTQEEKRVINDFKEKADKLKKAKAKLETQKEELDEAKTEVEDSRAECVSKRKEKKADQDEYSQTVAGLEAQYEKKQAYIGSLDQSSSQYQSLLSNLRQQQKQAEAQIEAQLSAYYATSTTAAAYDSTTLAGGNNGGSGGENSPTPGATGAPYTSNDTWAWPLGGRSCYISSGFGNRSASISGWSFHGGIDITGGGIYGAPVYATRAGTVIAAVWGDTGYGRYVMIDHGDGFVSIYGHCSSLSVSTGQSVSKGQMIANVGSTGNSTGPHLHFEIRYQGNKVNPLNYVNH